MPYIVRRIGWFEGFVGGFAGEHLGGIDYFFWCERLGVVFVGIMRLFEQFRDYLPVAGCRQLGLVALDAAMHHRTLGHVRGILDRWLGLERPVEKLHAGAGHFAEDLL